MGHRRTLVALVLAVSGMAGCNGNSKDAPQADAGQAKKAADAGKPSNGTPTASGAAKSAAAGAAVPYYEEIERDKIIYVVGSKASADKLRSTGKLTPYVSALGFGPAGKKVYFESDKDGLENKLMAEYDRRHPAKK